MFATLRCRKNSFSVERAGPTYLRLACNNCRSKKLRCSSEQTGCQRCAASQVKCDYTEVLHKRATRERQIGSSPSASASIAGRNLRLPIERPVLAVDVNNNKKTNAKNLISLLGGPESDKLLSKNSLDVPNDNFEISNSIVNDFWEPNIGGSWQPMNALPPGFFDPIYSTQNCMDDSEPRSGDDTSTAAEVGNLSDCQNLRTPLTYKRAPNYQHDALPEILRYNDQNKSSAVSHQDSNAAETPETDLDWGQKMQQDQLAMSALPEPERLPLYPGTSNGTSCQCVLVALNLLEKLQTEDHHRGSSDTVDHILELSKHALKQCLELLNCQTCMNTSRFTMLIISLCQVVVASWEKSVATLETEHQTLHEGGTAGTNEEGEDGDLTDMARPDGLQAMDSNIYLKSYKIDDSEQLYVFATLVQLQFSKWRAFLSRLKSVLSRLELETQVAMLRDLDRRISAQQNICTDLLFDVGKQ